MENDDLEDAAQKLRLLLTDAGLRVRLALAGRKVLEQRYNLGETNRRTCQAFLGPAFSPELLCSPGTQVADRVRTVCALNAACVRPRPRYAGLLCAVARANRKRK